MSSKRKRGTIAPPLYAFIDLSQQEFREYPIPYDMFRKYLGGKALAAKLLLQLTPAGLDPFDPDSVVIVNTGPLNGTGAPSSSRFNMTFKNVLTGGIASSNCGGDFGIMLRKSGFDGLILTGVSPAPVWLEVVDRQVHFHDAQDLWGLDTEEAQDKLPAHSGTVAIGPAGENLVRYAAVASGQRMAARCGSGAVLGAKKVKAISAYGSRVVPVNNKAKFDNYVVNWTEFLQNHPMTGDALPRYGSAGLVNPANSTHALPTKNFQKGHFDSAQKVSGETMAETHLTRNASCISCPIRCERRVRMGEKEVKGPEYETLGLLGPNIGSDDLDEIIRLNYHCDLLGLDTISLAGTLAFAMELGEKGVADFGVEFGNIENILAVSEKIAHREGRYDELANGTKWLSEKYGGTEYAMHAKGLELASYEPRRSVGMGLGYAVSNRGGCHLNGGYLALLESVGVLSTDPQDPSAKPALTVFMQNALEAVSSAGFCLFSAQSFVPSIFFSKGPNHWLTRLTGKIATHSGPMVSLLLKMTPALKFSSFYLLPHAKAIALATGLPCGTGDFLDYGNRGYNIERLYNLREGLTHKDDTLPKRLTEVPQDPEDPSTVVPLEEMLPRYYKVRGWDAKGVPTAATLGKLGIDRKAWAQ